MWWCLHGSLGSPRDWDHLDLPPHRAVDLWQQSPQATTMADWGRLWSQSVLRQDPRPSLLGYSLGGRLALHALLAAPNRWRQAIIVSAHPGLSDPGERRARIRHDAHWLQRFQTEPWTQVRADWNAQPALTSPPPSTPGSPGGTETLPGPSPTGFIPEMARAFTEWSLGRQEPLWDLLPTVNTPVHWLCGACDPKFAALGQKAVSRLPQGRYLEIPNCGHRVPWQWPDFAPFVRSLECSPGP